MSFKISQQDDIAIITMTERRFDAKAAPSLKAGVSDIVEAGTTRILLDLDSVQFMDSSGLGAVIASFKLTGPKGEFVICNMGSAIEELFVLTHMDTLFEVFPSTQEGLQKMCA